MEARDALARTLNGRLSSDMDNRAAIALAEIMLHELEIAGFSVIRTDDFLTVDQLLKATLEELAVLRGDPQ